MNRLVNGVAALVFSTLVATVALAGESEGTIVEINVDNGTISLSDGAVYEIPVDFYVDDLEPGMKVRVMFDVEDGRKVLADLQIEQ